MVSTLFGNVKKSLVLSEAEEKRIDIWGMINSVKTTKEYAFDETTSKEYLPWIVNKALSANIEYIYHVDRMNTFHDLNNRMQYDYYFYALPKIKMFKKWIKKEQVIDEKYILALANLSKISLKKAKSAWHTMSKDQKKTFISKFVEPELKNTKTNK
jgi:hypothetical protein